jgi:hypothetical protein
VRAAEEIVVTFTRGKMTPARLLPYVVGILGLVFALALLYALKQRRIKKAPAKTRGRS